MLKLFKKYFSINKIERRILNQTFFWLIYATILARIVPLRWFNRILGEFKPARPVYMPNGIAGGKEVEIELNSEQKELVQLLKKDLRRWKRFFPWKVKCFEEAIAAKKVLEKYKIFSTIYLGVDKNENKELIAHAWLKVGNKFITGEKGFHKFVVVGFYS